MRAAREIALANRTAISDAALILKRSIEKERDHAVGADGRLSGVGKRGAKLGVGYDIKGTNNPTALLQARGPWQLVERDVQPHIVGAKSLGTRASIRKRAGGGRGAFAGLKPRAGAKALAFGGLYRATARHPGTRGKQPWQRGIDAGYDPALRRLQTVYRHALKKAVGL